MSVETLQKPLLVTLDKAIPSQYAIEKPYGNYLISGRGVSRETKNYNTGALYRCGDFLKLLVVPGTEHYKVITHSCYMQGCPICFRRYAQKRGFKHGSYLWDLAQYLQTTLFHCVISPAEIPDTMTDKYISTWKKRIKAFLLKFHEGKVDVGWSLVFHPYRGTKESWRRGPHFHLITNFWFQKRSYAKVRKYMEKYKFWFTNISVEKGKPLDDRIKVQKKIRYELSHACWVLGKKSTHAISASGSFFPGKYNSVEIISDVPQLDSKGNYYVEVLRTEEGAEYIDKNYQIFEYPIDWKDKTYSKPRPIRDCMEIHPDFGFHGFCQFDIFGFVESDIVYTSKCYTYQFSPRTGKTPVKVLPRPFLITPYEPTIEDIELMHQEGWV